MTVSLIRCDFFQGIPLAVSNDNDYKRNLRLDLAEKKTGERSATVHLTHTFSS